MQKITPHLWFKSSEDLESAMNFYMSIFNDAKVLNEAKYPEGAPGPAKAGDLMTASFELEGFQFMALNGGPEFTFNPSISFYVWAGDVKRVEELWGKLSVGGKVLMELGEYPFREKYGWVQDKFGISWQILNGENDQKIVPSLLYVGNKAGRAEEAMKLYTSLFEDSSIGQITRHTQGNGEKEGTVAYGEFTLAGQKFVAMDSALDHKFNFNEAISLLVDCKDQAEVNKYWNKLTADGGEESMCGWLKDKFGVSWQIVPAALGQLMSDPDPEKAQRTMQAMLKMQKIDIDELQKAHG